MQNEPIVTIPQGKLRGYIATDIDGNKYHSFQGIPYAKPPIGELRFKAPVALEQWSGTLNATSCGSPCCGVHPLQTNTLIGCENCLFLNVYTKNVNSNKLKPVMFQIHGGGFVGGSGCTDFYGPDFLITEDVVIVTVNYRVGIWGFLSLEDPALEVPGNAGLKDIVLGLKWVQSNITYFGGDPENVTVVGQSSGGITVHLLLLSKVSKGLFHKAIAQSGSAFIFGNEGRKGVREISPLINAKYSEKEIYECLKKMSTEDLKKIQKKLKFRIIPSRQSLFGFVVEYPNEHAFLTENPLTLMLRGDFEKVPFIMGHTSYECLAFNVPRTYQPPGEETCEDMIPYSLGYKIGSAESQNMAREMRKFFLGSDQLVSNYHPKTLLASDVIFMYGIYTTAMICIQKSEAPLYFYRMTVESSLNLMKKYLQLKLPGVAHFDDVGYLFKSVVTPEIEPGSREDIGMRRFVRMWTNFAKYGNPTPLIDDPLLGVIWKPVTKQEFNFLDIGENLKASSNPDELRRVFFLKRLFEKHSPKPKSCL